NFLGGSVFDIAVLLILELPLAIGVRGSLVAESCGPSREGIHRVSVLQDRGVNVHHVAVVELQLFTNYESAGRILERQIRGSGYGTAFGSHIQRRIQLIA